MHKIRYTVGALLCAVCMILSACSVSNERKNTGAASSGSSSAESPENSAETTCGEEISESAGTQDEPGGLLEENSSLSAGGLGETITLPDIHGEEVSGEPISIYETGKTRITYTQNISNVRYITSASMVPDYEGLEGYDETYFETRALVVVTETVSSGSVQVGIEAITVDGTNAFVTLSHEMSGDAGTADMATWILWAEVDLGLDCQWTVVNAALESELEAY